MPRQCSPNVPTHAQPRPRVAPGAKHERECTVADLNERDPLLTEEQAARYLGVKPASLQVWRSKRRYSIAYIKVGRLVRYRQSALDKFLASREIAA